MTTVQPTAWQAILMGFIQGITEFLPISSTAHLRIVPALMGWPDFGVSFSAVIQVGSLIAVLAYFANDLRTVGYGAWQAWQVKDFQEPTFKTAIGVGVGTLPILLAGALVKIMFGSPPRQLSVIALALIVLAVILGVAEKVGRRQRRLADIRVADGVWVGLAQMLALVPGVSRSGATLTAGLFLGLERAAAARYSFLLGIPSLAIAGLVEFVSDFEAEALWPQFLGTLSAFIFSYLSIDWLMKFLQKGNTWGFIIYRISLGVVLLWGLTQNWWI